MDTVQGGKDAQMDISNILSSVNSKEEFMNFLTHFAYLVRINVDMNMV